MKTCPPHTQTLMTKSARPILPPPSLCHRKLAVPQVPSNFCPERTPKVDSPLYSDDFFRRRILGMWERPIPPKSVILVFPDRNQALDFLIHVKADYKKRNPLYYIKGDTEYRLTINGPELEVLTKGFGGKIVWI